MPNVKVLFFALAKERAGCAEIVQSISDETTLQHLKALIYDRFPKLEPIAPYLRWAVNEEFVTNDDLRLKAGDEVALIPPVSGGETSYLTESPLALQAVLEGVSGPENGAVVTFVGQVRNHTSKHSVTHLEYEAYVSMANRSIAKILSDTQTQWPSIQVDLRHRLGRVELAEPSVVIAVGSPHRAEAFEACRYVIERLKTDVPIFKREFREDGSVWIGQGS